MAFATTCPTNLTDKILASRRLGCRKDIYGNDLYICAPNELKTSLVEICNDGIMGIVEEGKLYNNVLDCRLLASTSCVFKLCIGHL